MVSLDDTQLLLLLDSIQELSQLASQLKTLAQLLFLDDTFNSSSAASVSLTDTTCSHIPLLEQSTRLFTKGG